MTRVTAYTDCDNCHCEIFVGDRRQISIDTIVLHFSNAEIVALIKESLTDDLLSPKMRKLRASKPRLKSRLFGHCYVATEALYHLLRARGETRWRSLCLAAIDSPDGDTTHWWLEASDEFGFTRLDPTAEQFGSDRPSYCYGVRKGFLTKEPSKRAEELIRRVRNKMVGW